MNKRFSPLIEISSQKLHCTPLTQDFFGQFLMTFTSSLHHVLKLCHTSAQNALKFKHGCKGRAIEEKAKFLLFCFPRTTKLMQRRSNAEKELWKIEFLLCVYRAHTLCTHLCKLVQVCCASIRAYGHTCFLRCMCVCVFVCLRSRRPVCLCEFCKLFTALAVSIHCWWQWKVCLIVVVPQWKFNSAPFH